VSDNFAKKNIFVTSSNIIIVSFENPSMISIVRY